MEAGRLVGGARGDRRSAHRIVNDLVRADDDRQRSMGFSDLLHSVRPPGSVRVDD
jgi:hypothetical protein